MIDFNALGEDLLTLLQRHHLVPDNVGVDIILDPATFDRMGGDHPHLIDGRTLIVTVTVDDIQAAIQVRRRYEIPPEAILTPVVSCPNSPSSG